MTVGGAIRGLGRAVAVAGLGMVLTAPAAQASDSWPCGAQTTKSWSSEKVQLCPLTGALAPNGWVPVYSSPVAVPDAQQPPQPAGWLHGIDNQYFVCQQYFADADYNHPAQTWHNNWWAWTLSDSPSVWGWVPEVYFKGGNDDEADAGLRRCESQPAPSPSPSPQPQPPPGTPTTTPPPAAPVQASPAAPDVDPGGCEPLPASASVVLHADLGRARRTRTVDVGRRVAVHGRLLGPDGTPLANAPLCVAARPATVDGATRVVGATHTNAAGEFLYIIAPNMSQQVSVVHRDAGAAASDTVDLRVRIPMRLHAARRRLHNGDWLRLRGLLDRVPNPSGVVVLFEARRGRHWQPFGSDTTDGHGAYHLNYHFTRTIGVQHYRLRVRIPEQTGFPYAPSASRTIRVRVAG